MVIFGGLIVGCVIDSNRRKVVEKNRICFIILFYSNIVINDGKFFSSCSFD